MTLAGESINEEALEQGLARVEEARQWSPRVVSKLEALIRIEDELDLFRVNPIRFASERDIDEDESIDLFLHAAHAGLFEMEWNIVCASCANVFRSFRKLEKVDPHFRCNICNMENSLSLDSFIQVTYTISPSVREIVMHHPDQLTVEQILFDFRFSKETKPQYENDWTIKDLMRAWTRRLDLLAPGETITFDVEMKGAVLACRDLMGQTSVCFMDVADFPSPDKPLRIEIAESGFEPVGEETSQLDIDLPMGRFTFPQVHYQGPGPFTVQVENTTVEPRTFWALQYPPLDSFEPRSVELYPTLSAKRVLNSATFHKLFRSQIPPDQEGLSIDDLTYLFTDLKGSTAMYDSIGDVTAYNLVRLHFEVLNTAVTNHNGLVVKTIGDAIMASFLDPVDAVAAALDMIEGLESFNENMSADLNLKVGIHRGHSMAVKLNGRLDYFGQNVNIAARTQQLSETGVLMTIDVAEARGVREALDGYALKPVEAAMRGIAEEIPIFQVTNAI